MATLVMFGRRTPSGCAGLTACVVSIHSVTIRAPPFQLPGLHAKAKHVSEVANEISRLSHSQSERLHAQLLCASGLLGAQGGRPAVWEAAKDAPSFSRCASCNSSQMEQQSDGTRLKHNNSQQAVPAFLQNGLIRHLPSAHTSIRFCPAFW